MNEAPDPPAQVPVPAPAVSSGAGSEPDGPVAAVPAGIAGPSAGSEPDEAVAAAGSVADSVPAPRAPAAPQRVRVVLADGRERVRTDPVLEIREQTGVGEVLVSGLIRAQLALAVRLAALVAGLFGVLPLLFALAPRLASTRVFGVELPWLLLGVLAYPVLLGIAWVYVRLADRNERDFVAMVDRE